FSYIMTLISVSGKSEATVWCAHEPITPAFRQLHPFADRRRGLRDARACTWHGRDPVWLDHRPGHCPALFLAWRQAIAPGHYRGRHALAPASSGVHLHLRHVPPAGAGPEAGAA